MSNPDISENPETTGQNWQTKEVIDHAKHDLQARLSDVKDAARHTAHEVKATAATTAAAAREGYHALREDAAVHFYTYREELEHHIRQDPIKMLGVAALGGFVLGLIFRK